MSDPTFEPSDRLLITPPEWHEVQVSCSERHHPLDPICLDCLFVVWCGWMLTFYGTRPRADS
jgi:hypothetical protein